MDYVLVFRGICILVGPFDYCHKFADRLRENLIKQGRQGVADAEKIEIRHRLAADVIEFPKELQSIRKEIGA